VEELPTLTRSASRQLHQIEAHWQEGLDLGSTELCATALACLGLHLAITLPELLAAVSWELDQLEHSRRLLEVQL
jgi:hypothetical protein